MTHILNRVIGFKDQKDAKPIQASPDGRDGVHGRVNRIMSEESSTPQRFYIGHLQ
jgi:hypothetical protein